MSALATTDALTGLPNPRLIDGRLAIAWQRARREHSAVAVVVIDVDYFKKYNDRFGHPAGDECLKQVAAAKKMPRINKDDIHVPIDGNVVPIQAEVKQHDADIKGRKLIHLERYYGLIERGFLRLL